MRNTNLSFGERLFYLMKSRDIESGTDLARAMINSGIIPENPFDPDKSRKSAARTINDHLSTTSAENISGLWIKRYCDAFRCSADYLLGYISSPTQDVASAHDLTGLSDEAIEKLAKINRRNSMNHHTDIISTMIEDSNAQFFLSIYAQLIYFAMNPFDKNDPDSFIEFYLNTKTESPTGINARAHFQKETLLKSILLQKLTENIDKLTELYSQKFSRSPDKDLTENKDPAIPPEVLTITSFS